MTKFSAQSLLPLSCLHMKFSGIDKECMKAVLEHEETIKAVTGLELLVFEKRIIPGMYVSRANYSSEVSVDVKILLRGPGLMLSARFRTV